MNIPHEVIVEVLSWLPAKHLLKFKCVSKTWLELLTLDPHFAKLHLDRSIKSSSPSVLAFRFEEEKMNFYLATDYIACDKAQLLETPFHLSSTEYSVSGICNGLVCLSGARENKLYIWNPLTRDHITISYSSIPSCFSSPVQEFKDEAFAFGFRQDSNEYKILRFSTECDWTTGGPHLQLSAYTLGIDSSWRTVEEDISYPCFSGMVNNRLVNGVLHWFARKTGGSDTDIILGFDLKEEILRHILPPYDDRYDDLLDFKDIEELGGLLCVIVYHEMDCDVQIWAMKEYGVASSWTKLFTVRETGVSQFLFSTVILGAHNGDMILWDLLTMENSVELFRYNQETETIKSLEGFPFWFYHAFAYVASVVSPSVISGVWHIMT